jgi:hypothetical protein
MLILYVDYTTDSIAKALAIIDTHQVQATQSDFGKGNSAALFLNHFNPSDLGNGIIKTEIFNECTSNKIVLLFPDGVGIRNYLYSDVFEGVEKDLVLFHAFF